MKPLPPEDARAAALAAMQAAGVPLLDHEGLTIEIADFGLRRFETEGASIATLIATERYALKAIWLGPHQRLPEHRHPQVGEDVGKLETVRVVSGLLLLYRESLSECGRPVTTGECPEHYECTYVTEMQRGDQQTLDPGEKHSLRAGGDGAVIFSISSTVRDTMDEFTNPHVVR